MGLFRKRRSKKRDFYQMLYDQATKTLEGVEALERFMVDGSEEKGDVVERVEKEADDLRRILIDELNQTFITPIEREDIFALSRAVDDILDYSESTVEEMRVYELEPNEYLRKMVVTLTKATQEIHRAVFHLKEHPNVAAEHAVRAKSLENQMEHIYHDALADLVKRNDIAYMFKMREIYRHLSNSADRGDEAANIIGDIVVKMK
ncbi:MAG: DUF47 domain-containing protein [Candidatus Latescibacterota bacterium]|nr:MAG: DUF47 domain-containing protein [Candidatus Latescibacterota bacterium]